MNSRIEQFFNFSFGIKPNEFRLVQLFFLLLTSISAFYAASVSIAETLFLSQFNTKILEELLPWTYISIALLTIAITWCYDRFISNVNRIKLIINIDVFFTLSILVLRQLISFPQTHSWVYFFLIVWIDALSTCKIVLFFSLMGDYFSSLHAKRLYGYITSGMALGAILGGLSIYFLSQYFIIANLLYFSTLLLIINIIFTILISKTAIPYQHQHLLERDIKPVSFKKILSLKYLQLIFVIVAIIASIGILADYLMLLIASKSLQTEKLAEFFGKFFTYIGISQLLIETFLASWLLKRFGVLKILMLLPILLVLSSLFFIYQPVLFFAATINFLFLTFTETLDLLTRQLLYLPLPSRIRIRGQAFAEGILSSIGKIFGSMIIFLFALGHPPVKNFVYILLFFVLCWILLLVIIRPHYKKYLAASILDPITYTSEMTATYTDIKNIFSANELDKLLIDLFLTKDIYKQLFVLSIISKSSFTHIKTILLSNYANNVKIIKKLLTRIMKFGDHSDLDFVRNFFIYNNVSIQSKALMAYARIAKAESLPILLQFFSLNNSSLKLTAAIASFRYAGKKGRALTKDYLFNLLSNNKIKAAKLIGQIHHPQYQNELNQLILDKDHAVQRYALIACQKQNDIIPFIPNLLLAFSMRPHLRPLILRALYNLHESGISYLQNILAQPNTSDDVRHLLLNVIGKIGNTQALEVILGQISGKSSPIQLMAVHEALKIFRIHRNLNPAILPKLKFCQEILFDKLYSLRQYFQEMGSVPAKYRDFFADTIYFYSSLFFLLLGFEFGIKELANISHNVTTSDSTYFLAESLDVLETVLPRKLYLKIVKIVSPSLHEISFSRATPSAETLHSLLNMDIWIGTITKYSFGSFNHEKPIEEHAMGNQDKILLKRITIIAFIKQIELFSMIPANYLLSIADIVNEVIFYPNEKIFVEGDSGNCLYLISSGKVSIRHQNKEITQMGPGECIGELALLDQLPRSASAIALTETKLFRIDAKDFENILLTYPEVAESLLKILARRLRKSTTSISAKG